MTCWDNDGGGWPTADPWPLRSGVRSTYGGDPVSLLPPPLVVGVPARTRGDADSQVTGHVSGCEKSLRCNLRQRGIQAQSSQLPHGDAGAASEKDVIHAVVELLGIK